MAHPIRTVVACQIHIPHLCLGNCTGKPTGVLVLTCTCTHNGLVPMSTGTGLVTGTKLGTRTCTHGGFYLWVRPLGARVVRVRVHE